MLSKYAEMCDGGLDSVRTVKNRIDFEKFNARHIRSARYPAGPKSCDLEKEEIEKLVSMNVAETAQSEWESPIVFATKKDGSLRFFVYYSCYAITIRNSYPIPRMDELIDSLGNAKLFSTLDANREYWKIEIYTKDRDNTDFTPHHGIYRFIWMPFGLKKALETFQGAMDVILESVKWQFESVYLDDMVVFSNKVSD